MIELCNVCSSKLINAISFPSFPVTGKFREKNELIIKEEYNQNLMYCSSCNHYCLSNDLYIDKLYNDEYSFRTSESATAMNAADFFVDFLYRTFDNSIPFNNIVEFGCNDAYTLKKLKKQGRSLVGVDLIWKDSEDAFSDESIFIVGDKIESVDFSRFFKNGPDFIYSCHTLEHIQNPDKLFENLYKNTPHDIIFAMEFPCFDPLVECLRYDQIFHEHINYFSLSSVKYLLDNLGAELIDYTFNYNHWGALIIIFKKYGNIELNKKLNTTPLSLEKVQSGFSLFQKIMNNSKEIINRTNNKIYGYGAAQMLPALLYHLKISDSTLEGVIDDDINKQKLMYSNLSVPILPREDINIKESTILLTAMDNRRVILKNLYIQEPKKIISPLPVI